MTATLVVTNTAVTAQNLSGIVYSNGITLLANAVVVQPADGSGYTAAAVSDNSGHYSINVNPGSYGVMAVVPGYFMDTSVAPQVTLTNGMSATNNLSRLNDLGPAARARAR